MVRACLEGKSEVGLKGECEESVIKKQESLRLSFQQGFHFWRLKNREAESIHGDEVAFIHS